MADTAQLIKDFSDLDLETKKKKLLNMIKKIDTDRLPILPKIATAIQSNPLIDDQFCIDIYTEIMTLSDKISKIQADRAEEKLASIHDRLAEMRAREAKEKEEENADALLENI